MTKTRKILAICLIISVIATIVGVVSAVINPEVVFIITAAGPGIITVVLCIALLSSKKEDGK